MMQLIDFPNLRAVFARYKQVAAPILPRHFEKLFCFLDYRIIVTSEFTLSPMDLRMRIKPNTQQTNFLEFIHNPESAFY